MKRHAIRSYAAVLSVVWSVSSYADPGADLYKAKICNTCHGEDGTHPVSEDIPIVAGQPVKYLIRQMKDIRDGRRNNGLSESMRASVSEVTDEEMEIIAEWLATRW